MNNNFKIFFALISVVFNISHLFSQIIINEIMSSNVSCVVVDKEFPNSWVEFRNITDKTFLLSGFRIGEEFDFDNAYKLPDFEIEAGEYKLIYCDKKATGLHTDFTLEQESGKLYLFDKSGNVVNALKYNKIPPIMSPVATILRIQRCGDTCWNLLLEPQTV